jgi:DMSO/TMAO reductase YedYZ heme-binding membrane subunit
MSALPELQRTFNDRTRKIMTFIAVLMAAVIGTIAVIGFVIVGAGGLVLLTGMNLSELASAVLRITGKTPWYLSRSAGTVAYLLLLGSTVWGLLLSSKIVKEAVPAALSLAMHNILSWLALAFTGVHALVLLLDNFYTYTISDLTIPFIGPYRPGWVGLGIIAFYMMALISISFSFRKQMGQKRWRKLHYLSFAVFILATVHGIGAGTDSSKMGMQFIYLGSGLLVFFLSTYRLLTAKESELAHKRIE